MSHLLNSTGEALNCQALLRWAKKWTSATSGANFKTAFRQAVKVAYPTFSAIRWHSRWVQILVLWDHWDAIGQFLATHPEFGTDSPVRVPFLADHQLSPDDQKEKRKVKCVLSPPHFHLPSYPRVGKVKCV